MDVRLAEWFAGDDTGSSSKAIALFMSAAVATRSTPSDCDDLGRCLRLLAIFPEWKANFARMAKAGGEWKTLAPKWPELEASFLEEGGGLLKPHYGTKMPKTYDMLQVLHADALEADGYVVERSPQGHLRSATKGKAQTFSFGKGATVSMGGA